MEQTLFHKRFVDAAQLAREFAQQFLIEELPERIVFDLHLNASYDFNACAEFTLFPEDSLEETTWLTKRIDEITAMRWLYRDGKVPQWINFQVVGISRDATRIGAEACGRFIANEQNLYHKAEGRPPFHVLGPSHPVGYEDGAKFSIFYRSDCWSIDDLKFLAQSNAKVWYLKISGPDFTDQLPEKSLRFDTMEILELIQTATAGALLQAISEIPRLRILRIEAIDAARIDLSWLPSNTETITEFSFRRMPAEVTGGRQIRIAFPGITKLCLTSTHQVEWDNPPELTGLDRLVLSFPHHLSWIRNIAGTQSVSLTFDSCFSHEILALLDTGKSSLKTVVLRGTPIGNEIFEVLARMPNLEHFDVVNTKVTTESLLSFKSIRPELTCWPRLNCYGVL